MSAPDELAEMKRYQWHADLHDYVNCATGEKCVANWVVPASDADRVIAARDAEITFYRSRVASLDGTILALLSERDEAKASIASRDAEIGRLREAFDRLNTLTAEAAKQLRDERDAARAQRKPFDPVLLSMLYSAADSCAPTLRGAVLRAYDYIAGDSQLAALTPPSQAPEARRDVGGEKPATHNHQ